MLSRSGFMSCILSSCGKAFVSRLLTIQKAGSLVKYNILSPCSPLSRTMKILSWSKSNYKSITKGSQKFERFLQRRIEASRGYRWKLMKSHPEQNWRNIKKDSWNYTTRSVCSHRGITLFTWQKGIGILQHGNHVDCAHSCWLCTACCTHVCSYSKRYSRASIW